MTLVIKFIFKSLTKKFPYLHKKIQAAGTKKLLC